MKYKRNHSKSQSLKTKFRRSAKWTKFRRHMKAKQKTDPITGSPLTPTCSVHHLDMREENYEDLSDETHFVALNATSHETCHFLWQAHGGWRHAVLSLIRILKAMERINKGHD
jgi:hypothetical protein